MADLLFAGAGLTAAAVVVRGLGSPVDPGPLETPGAQECVKPEVVTDVLPEDVPMPGAVAVPEPELTPTPTPQVEATIEVVPRGRVAVPAEPQPAGGLVVPEPGH